jgi:hypothetical protein
MLALAEALMQLHLNALLGRLNELDVKLRSIWRHLVKYDCYDLNADDESDQFWW